MNRWKEDAAAQNIPNWQQYMIAQLKGSDVAIIYQVDPARPEHVTNHWRKDNYTDAFEWLKDKLLVEQTTNLKKTP